MVDRKRLIELLRVPLYPRIKEETAEEVADYLIDNDIMPVVHGRWVMQKFPLTQCSVCAAVRDCEHEIGLNYCPNCGAKMDGEEDYD